MVKGPYTFESPEDIEALNEDEDSHVDRRPLVSTKINLGHRSGPKSRASKNGEPSADRRLISGFTQTT